MENLPLDSIAEKVGTPCYVYSQTALTHNYQTYVNGLSNRTATICFSVKSNSNLAILALMANLGSGFDIVSGGELTRVIQAGGDPNRIVFSGVGKSSEEIAYALQSDVFSINIESNGELDRIANIAKDLNKTAPISVRVNPDVDANTHPHIATGLRQSKFGVQMEDALQLYQLAAKLEFVRPIGVAVHIGSQMTTVQPIVNAIERVIDLVETLQDDGIDIEHLDLGGGLGIAYSDEQPPTVHEYCYAISEVLDRRGCQLPITVEPGRSITANTGVLLCTVEYIKQNDSKNFAVVNGAMNDLIRPVLYNAWMKITPVQITSNRTEKTYDIVGPICESADWLGRGRSLAIAEGDLLAVLDAGAYGSVMSSNYNTRPKPAEVLVNGDQFEIVRQRETIADLLRLEQIPERLKH